MDGDDAFAFEYESSDSDDFQQEETQDADSQLQFDLEDEGDFSLRQSGKEKFKSQILYTPPTIADGVGNANDKDGIESSVEVMKTITETPISNLSATSLFELPVMTSEADGQLAVLESPTEQQLEVNPPILSNNTAEHKETCSRTSQELSGRTPQGSQNESEGPYLELLLRLPISLSRCKTQLLALGSLETLYSDVNSCYCIIFFFFFFFFFF